MKDKILSRLTKIFLNLILTFSYLLCYVNAQPDRDEGRIWSVNEYRSEIYGHTKQNNLLTNQSL